MCKFSQLLQGSCVLLFVIDVQDTVKGTALTLKRIVNDGHAHIYVCLIDSFFLNFIWMQMYLNNVGNDT